MNLWGPMVFDKHSTSGKHPPHPPHSARHLPLSGEGKKRASKASPCRGSWHGAAVTDEVENPFLHQGYWHCTNLKLSTSSAPLRSAPSPVRGRQKTRPHGFPPEEKRKKTSAFSSGCPMCYSSVLSTFSSVGRKGLNMGSIRRLPSSADSEGRKKSGTTKRSTR